MNKPTTYKLFAGLGVLAYGAFAAADLWQHKHRMYTHVKTLASHPANLSADTLLCKKGDIAIDRISGRSVVVEGFKGKNILVAGRDGGPVYMRTINLLEKDFTV